MRNIFVGLALAVSLTAYAQHEPTCCEPAETPACTQKISGTQQTPQKTPVSADMVEINCPSHGRVVFPAAMAAAGHMMPCCEKGERNNFVKINCPGHGDMLVYKSLYDAGHHMPCCEKVKPRKIDASCEHSDSHEESVHDLAEVAVVRKKASVARMAGAVNGLKIGRDELFKAACCNLGESFTTNPSVDVTYNDATTGARQIKLLGLSGTYVQMLTENLPNFRGAATPYALGYVPGPWMKGIQVSKGAASVKNGYESITGQINIDYKKPEDKSGAEFNLFGDTKSRIEANADANVHINSNLSGNILVHYENSMENHDDNGDGFLDKPRVEQYNLQSRWLYSRGIYMLHAGIAGMEENRWGGQAAHHQATGQQPFTIGLATHRYEAYAKHAFVLDTDHGTNVALMTSAAMHQLQSHYGIKWYDVNEKNVYGALLFETNFTKQHNLSAGLNVNYDYLGQYYREGGDGQVQPTSGNRWAERETVPGAYVQYTYTLGSQLTAMAGLRVDHSSLYGTFYTPRFHLKYMPTDILTLRFSAGKGYRTVHALAESNYLLASGRELRIGNLGQEAAWNTGVSMAFNIPLGQETLKVNAEYYYTRFSNQAVIDYDSNHQLISIDNLQGRSYSHTFQIDASYVFFKSLTLTAAYRLNDVKTTYGGILRERPLTSKYKGLFTASYKTPDGRWQIDGTLQLNGGGRMPQPYQLADGTQSWNRRFKAYEQVSAQLTRWFKHWSVYVGGENLTGFTQHTTIYGADNPWGADFEPTLIWGPVHGRMFYAGVRVNI
ncbi:MAG: TonB-dependent receptor [Prevotella sp.]|nr:TonB-dependent receptor [Prevotella sp.]